LAGLVALGDLADQTLAGFRERDDGRRGSPTLFVRDHFGLTALHNGDDRVGRAEIDADNLCHCVVLLRSAVPLARMALE
jgi:hypothetical protein